MQTYFKNPHKYGFQNSYSSIHHRLLLLLSLLLLNYTRNISDTELHRSFTSMHQQTFCLFLKYVFYLVWVAVVASKSTIGYFTVMIEACPEADISHLTSNVW